MPAKIDLDGVTKRYGPVTALDDVTVQFGPGAVHCLAGPNGSGKTTVLRLAAGLTRATSGTVSAPDAPGYAFQRPSLYPDLTVAENLDVFSELVGADPEWRAHLAERLRLRPARRRVAADLSDGYAKKLDLALALLKEPRVLLLDEPLADLDDLTVSRLVDLLAEYRDDRRTVVVSSHRLGRLEGLLDRLVVVRDGWVRLDRATAGLDRPVADVYADAVRTADGG
ncbi:MAG: ATP-binding cassette domain-containing protein [Halobacteriaceae archaeon]